MSFAETLKYLRETNNLTQKELAKKSRLSSQCISSLEQGTRSPTGITLTALSNVLNVSTDYLLGLEDDFGVRTSAPIGDDMTADEREMIKKIRLLPKESRNLIEQMIDTLSGTSTSSVTKKQA